MPKINSSNKQNNGRRRIQIQTSLMHGLKKIHKKNSEFNILFFHTLCTTASASTISTATTLRRRINLAPKCNTYTHNTPNKHKSSIHNHTQHINYTFTVIYQDRKYIMVESHSVTYYAGIYYAGDAPCGGCSCGDILLR